MPRDKTSGRRGFQEPFTTAHLFQNPQEAVSFYEEATGNTIPQAFRQFLSDVAEWDDQVVFCVQPGFSMNYITAARKGDRRAWFYLRPSSLTVWVGNYRNLEAIVDHFAVTREPKDEKSKWLRPNVVFTPENVADESAMFCVAMAASWAIPGSDNSAETRV